MPRNSHKKFMAARKGRLDRLRASLLFERVRQTKMLCALRVPLVVAVVYVVLRTLGVATIMYPAAHYAALVIWFVWVVQAVRGALGFWSHRAHMRFALPLIALVILGSVWGIKTSPAAKAWVVPPPYAREPSTHLSDQTKRVAVLSGGIAHVHWQGETGLLHAYFNGETQEIEADGKVEATQSFPLPRVGKTTTMTLVLRRGLARLGRWTFDVLPDAPPRIQLTEEPEITTRKTIRLAYEAMDDYGVESVIVRAMPLSPQQGGVVASVDVPLDRPMIKQIKTASYVDLTHLPWLDVPVSLQIKAVDGAGQEAWSTVKTITLPARTFRNPFARALIEEREKLIKQPDPAMRDEAANVMAGIARQQSLYRGDKVAMMALRAAAVRLVFSRGQADIMPIALIMWQTALRLEEGEVGVARADLADAEHDLSMALLREQASEETLMYWLRLEESLARYFDALDNERARQPPALQELDWPLATAQDMLGPEDLQNRLNGIGELLKTGKGEEARTQLAQFQMLIENLRTTPPELTPAQSVLAQQVSALRALARGQKTLNDEIDKWAEVRPVTLKERKALQDQVTRGLAQQQLLLAALRDVVNQTGLSCGESSAAQAAMSRASTALQEKNLKEAQEAQAEALALIQNALLTLSDQIKAAMAAKTP